MIKQHQQNTVTWKTGPQLAQEYHQYERRAHPLEMWQALYHQVRLHHISLTQSLGTNEIAFSIGNWKFCYPATIRGIKEALKDIERLFNND